MQVRARAGWPATYSRKAARPTRTPWGQSLLPDRRRRLHDAAHRLLDGVVGGGEEAVLLAGEVLVEGVAGDPGPLDDVGDGDRPVALVDGLLGERVDDAGALMANDELAREGVPSWRHPHRGGSTVGHEIHGTRETLLSKSSRIPLKYPIQDVYLRPAKPYGDQDRADGKSSENGSWRGCCSAVGEEGYEAASVRSVLDPRRPLPAGLLRQLRRQGRVLSWRRSTSGWSGWRRDSRRRSPGPARAPTGARGCGRAWPSSSPSAKTSRRSRGPSSSRSTCPAARRC